MLTVRYELNTEKKLRLIFACKVLNVTIKFALEQVMKTQMESRRIAQSFLNLGTRWRWVVIAKLRPFYLRE
jgi:hypothetical protein